MKKIKYENGSVYYGDTKGIFSRVRDGFGTLTDSRGNVFSGVWHNDVQHGKGEIAFANGDVFKGVWEYGQRKSGRLDFKDGSYYEGEFFGSNYSGNGELYDKSTDTKYVGHFSGGKKYGEGIEACPRYKYKGRYVSDKFHFYGRLEMADGDYYDGVFEFGKFIRGKCRITNSDGSVYLGDMDNSLYEGQGVLTLKNGEAYSGEFKAGRFMGGDTASESRTRTTEKRSDIPDKSSADMRMEKLFYDLEIEVKKAVSDALYYYNIVKSPKPTASGAVAKTPESAAQDARYNSARAKEKVEAFEERSVKEHSSIGALSNAETISGGNVIGACRYKGQTNYKNYPHGYGILTYSETSYYEGEFDNASLSGLGRFEKNGYVYTGQFDNSKINGFGRRLCPDGNIYEGLFQGGRLVSGVWIDANGRVRYEGEFGEELKLDGYGISYENNAQIGAEFSNGSAKYCGWCRMSELTFTGKFGVGNVGYCGVVEYDDGKRIEGCLNGYGKLISGDLVIMGRFNNGEIGGYCIATTRDGEKIRCRYENDVITERY